MSMGTAVGFPLSQPGGVTQRSPAEAKIALFRSLFHGREDVYPRRFESRKTGRAGYSPACANEWLQGICKRPKIKCSECPRQRFLPVTDDVIRRHLCGQDENGHDFVMGVYPMLLDETCFFLAADFDKATWRDEDEKNRDSHLFCHLFWVDLNPPMARNRRKKELARDSTVLKASIFC